MGKKFGDFFSFISRIYFKQFTCLAVVLALPFLLCLFSIVSSLFIFLLST
uniref:Uncharacterized protein n=1 Tax=Arundo donax TaxID=35708 RepID=A0A0A9B7I8_ARUDO